jgi:hypothetical protein
MGRTFPDAHAFLAGRQTMQLPAYVIGGRTERRVTLYSQQCRALNLIAALDAVYGDALRMMRVAVVGAGASGLVAATALRGLNMSKVAIFDEAAAPMHPQRASFTRFLHPTLFHWPESGWEQDEADLPIGGWKAGYADDVRNEVLSTCGGVPIRYCTTVEDISPHDKGVCLHLKRLGEHDTTLEVFDLAIVAAGFPAEQPPAGATGGSYWHAVAGLQDQPGDVHIIGDGDGALTELLMLYIDLLGHGAVKRMARLLKATDELRRHDLTVQGDPNVKTETPSTVRNDVLLDVLKDLDPGRRSVTIHADQALKGRSFLLNRVLVAHMRWLPDSSVRVYERDVANPRTLSGTVIWRAGLANARPIRRFEEPALSTNLALSALGDTLDAFARGALVQAIDALRRPLWSSRYAELISTRADAWYPQPPVGLKAFSAAATEACGAALPEMVATARELRSLGVGLRPDAIDFAEQVISIETVVRVLSIPHSDCVRAQSTGGDARRDSEGRVWFRFPGSSGVPTRRAVAALVDPEGLRTWAHESARNRERQEKLWRDQKQRVHVETLRGLTDLSTVDLTVLRSTWRAHFEREEYDDAIRALLRRARDPLDNARRSGDRTRKALLDAALVVSAAPRVEWFDGHDQWVLLAAAASRLVVPLRERELSAGENFIVSRWAPRVRSLAGDVPPWFAELGALADKIPPPGTRGSRTPVGKVVDAATTALHRRSRDELRPLARFGVRPAQEPPRTGQGGAPGIG